MKNLLLESTFDISNAESKIKVELNLSPIYIKKNSLKKQEYKYIEKGNLLNFAKI